MLNLLKLEKIKINNELIDCFFAYDSITKKLELKL